VVLVLASIAGGVSPVSSGRAVDIRDVQVVERALLANGTASFNADLNHDGRVDVLDFQCAVNRATGSVKGHAPSRTPAPSPAQNSSNRASTLLLALKASARTYLSPLAQVKLRSLSELPMINFGTSSEVRQQRGLSPHAPPCC